MWLIRYGKHDRAERLLRDAVRLAPSQISLRGDLCQLLIDLKRLDEAEIQVKEIELLAPYSREAALTRSSLLRARGQRFEAIRSLQRFIDRGSADPVILSALEMMKRAL